MTKKTFLLTLSLLLTMWLSGSALAQAPIECDFEYTVQQGDWLSKISSKYFGDPLAYDQLVLAGNANPDDPYTNIDDANVIEPGWTLCIPKNNNVVFRGGTAPVGANSKGAPSGTLTQVTSVAQPGFQQFIFQFGPGGIPAFDLRYLNDANINHETGETVPLNGQVKLRFITDPGTLDGYNGETRIAATGDPNVTEAIYVGQEGTRMQWAIGMNQQAGYLVAQLNNPPRIVIDIFDPVPELTNQPSLRPGDTSDAVTALQQELVESGFLSAADVTGDFDETTRQAVTAYELAHGLTPDGVVGPELWSRLLNETSAADAPTASTAPPPSAAAPGADNTVERDRLGFRTHTPDGQPVVYFTFDDGPGPYTQQYLDLLGQYNAHGTFFVIGRQVEAYRDVLRNEATGGHYVANHTWDHANLTDLTRDAYFEEVDSTYQAIIDAAGDLFSLDGTVAYLRPPYGAMDEVTQQEAAERGYTSVLWTIDTVDWQNPGVEVIVNHVMDEVEPGAVVLMHDAGGNREQTIAALEQVLPQLQAQGYVFYNIWEGAQ